MMQRWLICLGSLLLMCIFVHAQSLPELAKQKTTTQKAKRVLTNDDFPTPPAPPVVAPDSQEAATADDNKPPMDLAQAAEIIQQTTADINLNLPIVKSLEDHLKAVDGDLDKEATLRQQIESLKQNIELWTAERTSAKEAIAAAAKKRPAEMQAKAVAQ